MRAAGAARVFGVPGVQAHRAQLAVRPAALGLRRGRRPRLGLGLLPQAPALRPQGQAAFFQAPGLRMERSLPCGKGRVFLTKRKRGPRRRPHSAPRPRSSRRRA